MKPQRNLARLAAKSRYASMKEMNAQYVKPTPLPLYRAPTNGDVYRAVIYLLSNLKGFF